MRRMVRLFVAVVTVNAAAGCSITGSWRMVAVEPPGMPFPLARVTFDRDGNYTASWTDNRTTHTSTGRYHWNGFALDVLQTASQPRTYRARRRLDGKLVLTYEEGKAKVSATLERVGE